ncbi:MAG TPA: hypothetical protein PLX89_22845 [Verrucomicrobiota bacterium]|nr:hypothetical protein [Verrucomicrobiales bacterium]HRI15846.1 hypothetical protein [Verrucomicrobiota bacterium]
MNIRLFYLPVVAAALSAGCQHRVPKSELDIRLTSATPVGFSGTVWIDGKEQPLEGKTPAELKVQAHTVRYQVRQSADNGTLTVEVHQKHHPNQLTRVAASTGPNTVAQDSLVFE